MSNFILIEQSLDGLGSHYFEYASHILGAADRAGFRPIVACHRSFSQEGLFPSHWSVRPIFPDRPGRLHRLSREFEYSARTHRSVWDKWLGLGPVVRARMAIDELIHLWRPLRYARRLARFYRTCKRLFDEFPLVDGDHVLLGTMGDLDLMGLRRFLQDHAWTERAAWHLQFHYAIFQGRDPDYAAQTFRAEGLKRRLENLVESAPRHRLHFYTTTDNMARQYNVLDAAPFFELPYPVNPEFHRRAVAAQDEQGRGRGDKSTPVPLRIACAGGLRREKGAHVLARIIESIPNDYRDRVQFLVQSDRSWTSKQFVDPARNPMIQSVQHPLTAEQYVNHICGADVGLLAYDSGQYWVRCSGILVEMLCAAVPVVVMAGNWLAHQIEQPIQRHLKQLAEQADISGPSVEMETSESRQSEWSKVVQLPRTPLSDAIVEFKCESQDLPGQFVRVDAEQQDADGKICDAFASTVSIAVGDEPWRVMVRISPDARTIRLRWRNAFGPTPIEIHSVHIRYLAGDPNGAGFPQGSVGLIAADPSLVPRLLCHLADHYPHFKQSARQFSVEWHRMHHPDRTMAVLLRGASSSRTRAA